MLKEKQAMAIELMTSGKGLNYLQISEAVGINERTLWRWRNLPEFKEFQEELARINAERWQAAEDAARQAAIDLCKDKNQKMVEFVLKNVGFNPTQKVEADVNTEITVTVEE